MVGNTTSMQPEPITLDAESLLRHLAIVDGADSGRIAAALNLVEQVLDGGVPAIVVDRTGEMSGYARPDWYQRSGDPVRAQRLAERIDVRLFTPGIRGGRPLAVAVVPDLSHVAATEHDRVARLTASAIAATMRGRASSDDPQRLDLLTRAITVLARRAPSAGLVELIALLESETHLPSLADGDDRVRQHLVDALLAQLGNPDVFTPSAEPLTLATLIRPGPDGRIPLAIINTSFLDDETRQQNWIAQLIGTVGSERASAGSTALQTLFVLDGAELLWPAGTGKALAKEPLHELLGRAGSAGLGIVLTSRRPEELDYRRCASIDTWFIGKTEGRVIEKMKPLFDHRPLGHRRLAQLESRRLVMLHEGGAHDVERRAPLLRIEQLGGVELKNLAARTHSHA